MQTHMFVDSVKKGHVWEEWVEKHIDEILPPSGLVLSYKRVNAGGTADRKGIDGYVFARLQVKGDEKSYDTKNVFVETESVHEAAVAGCIETSEADWFIFLLPGFGQVCWANGVKLRAILPRWKAEFPTGTAPNKRRDGSSYQTKGLLVPIGRFGEVVEHVCFNQSLFALFVASLKAA